MQEDIGKVKNSFYILNFSFIWFHKKIHKLFNSTPYRANCPIEDPVMAPGALIDVAKYLGSLSFHVWEKMHKIVKYSEYILFILLRWRKGL